MKYTEGILRVFLVDIPRTFGKEVPEMNLDEISGKILVAEILISRFIRIHIAEIAATYLNRLAKNVF